MDNLGGQMDRVGIRLNMSNSSFCMPAIPSAPAIPLPNVHHPHVIQVPPLEFSLAQPNHPLFTPPIPNPDRCNRVNLPETTHPTVQDATTHRSCWSREQNPPWPLSSDLNPGLLGFSGQRSYLVTLPNPSSFLFIVKGLFLFLFPPIPVSDTKTSRNRGRGAGNTLRTYWESSKHVAFWSKWFLPWVF